MRIVALLHVAEEAVRIVFDYEFHPKTLHKWIHSASVYKDIAVLRRYLTYMQWKTFFHTPANEGNFHNAPYLYVLLAWLSNYYDLRVTNES